MTVYVVGQLRFIDRAVYERYAVRRPLLCGSSSISFPRGIESREIGRPRT
jgi:hypothetical protein